ncbi:hypothetical protein PoB_006936400 [Plakobranchus ocellatus]|uniref:DDE Tnp4 domain-containing protein n=1 Tax=Plakobranchus ocellatus TaxID=259542 RepID=A0AAV4DF75_9GAST|nr:hypothetical protein PoB_006936400 [Plakobranchus ocellatus]
MVLLAVANANYELVYVNFGTNGRVSDGGVIDQTDFYTKLKHGNLQLPQVNSSNGLPYVFVGDEAFALRPDFLKPYNIRALDDMKRIFNYRLSRARRIVENVFGILVSRFGVLRSEIRLKPENIDCVVLACCALHNCLRNKAPTSYSPNDVLDQEEPITHVFQEGLRAIGPNIADIVPCHGRNSTDEAKSIRDKYTVYFNTVGKVSWQNRLALVNDSRDS